MNDKNVRKQVLSAILERGVIDNGNVVGTLTDKVKTGGLEGRDKILGALDTLERNGAIGVTRRGSHILKVYPKTKEAHQRSDPTDRSPGAKRESMFAKGIPSYLTDEMVSSVVVIKKGDRKLVTPNDMPAKSQSTNKAGEDSMTKKQTAEAPPAKLSFLEELNLAYTGLRCRADAKTGVLPVGSVHAFIMEDLKCSPSRATTLNQTLAKLGLRSTVNLGFGPKSEGLHRGSRHQSTVDPTVDAITQERLDSLKTSLETVKEVDEVPTPTPVVPDEPVTSPEDVVEKLVEIIKDLEKQITSLKEANKKDVNQLTHDLKTAQAEIAKLRAPAIAPEVASMLEKYHKI